MTGRRAALPPTGWAPPLRIVEGSTVVTVLFEGAAKAVTFDCGQWPVTPELRWAFMEGFAAITAPDGAHRTIATATRAHRGLGRLAKRLAGLERPPTRASEVTASHVGAFRIAARSDYSSLRSLLVLVPGLQPATLAALRVSPAPRSSALTLSMSRSEFSAVMTAARSDLRCARDRIHSRRELLDRWRAGLVEPESSEASRGKLLDYVERHDDVPRWKDGHPVYPQPGFASTHDLVCSFFLTAEELISAGILMVCLTGHNFSGVSGLTLSHHRADGHGAGRTPIAIVDVIKPRRGTRRRYMTTALTDVPDWISGTATGTDGLNTAFGLFSLVVDLAHEGRTRASTDRLFVGLGITGGVGKGRHWLVGLDAKCLTSRWADAHGLTISGDVGRRESLRVNWQRLRLTFVQLHQRGVAHTDATLVADYLARDRRPIHEYRQLVADVLKEQENAARKFGSMHTITTDDIAAFSREPGATAARLGLNVDVVRELIEGRRDTVLAGCVDEMTSPFATSEGPCEASFMMCTGCVNARVTPAHLPVQALAHHELLELRAQMRPDAWARRFGPATARLGEALASYPPAQVELARSRVQDDDRAAVIRMLAGELESYS